MVQTVGPSPATVGYRIRQGNVVGFVTMPYITGMVGTGAVRVVYDDGTEDDLFFSPSTTTTAGVAAISLTHVAKKDGWIVDGVAGFRVPQGGTAFKTSGYGQIVICIDINATPQNVIAVIGYGFYGTFRSVAVGQFIDDDFQATWVFQGTVGEDATAGSHVITLIVTPGAGNEMQLLYGNIRVGNTATAQVASVQVDDGTNTIGWILNGQGSSSTAVNENYPFPGTGQVTSALLSTDIDYLTSVPVLISGTMRLKLEVDTTAVSVTQSFAVACRIRGAPPTATLADTVGTPVLTTNTSAVFG